MQYKVNKKRKVERKGEELDQDFLSFDLVPENAFLCQESTHK